jgi:activating signal cointegrator complex subunit 1
LKLHATILNTIYANPGGRGKQPEAASKESGTRADSVAIVQQERDVSRAETGTNPSWADQQTATETPTSSANTGTSRGHGPNAKAPIRLDATALLERCKDFVWAADFALEKIAICKMGAKKITDEQGTIIDEQYEEVAFITLP